MDIHLVVHNERLRRHLHEVYGKDHRTRKGLNQYIETLAIMGLDRLEHRRAGRTLHYEGKSDLPSIDLFHFFKIDGFDLEEAIRLRMLNSHQIYNIEMTRRLLDASAYKPNYKKCIETLEREKYDWREYVK